MTPTDALVRTYFDRATSPDPETWFALFAPDAEVEDDGREHHGISEIRGWRSSVPDVTYDVRDVRTVADTTTATAGISGDFPGSPVTLTYRFRFDDDGLIRELTIRP